MSPRRSARACLGFLSALTVFACEPAAPDAPAARTVDANPGAQSKQPAPEEPAFARVEGERGLRAHSSGAFEGYTLISPLNSKSVHLVDMQGKTVHTWVTNHVPAGGAYFLDNGHLLRTAMIENNPRFHAGGIGGRIEELDWEGKVVWEYELATDQRTLHHDVSPMPNGNLLAIAWEYHSPEQVFEHGRSANRVHEEGLWCDIVLEIHPTPPSGGEIVWTWRSFDHIVQDIRPEGPRFGAPKDFPGRIDINADHRFDPPETEEEQRQREERERQMQGLGYGGGDRAAKDPNRSHGDPPKPKPKYDADWLHLNSVEYLAEHDLIALSTPTLCEVWVIDHGISTQSAAGSSGGRRGQGGELLYRLGNPRNYGIGDESNKRFYYQHHPTWQPGARPGRLAMLVFNNGDRRPGFEYSSVEEFQLPFDALRGFVRKPGEAFGPEAPSWIYNDPVRFFSPFVSGAQRLPNGNTLICEGGRGRVFEVTRAGEIVWDYYNPFGGEVEPSEQGGKSPAKSLFRATRVAKDHPSLAGKL